MLNNNTCVMRYMFILLTLAIACGGCVEREMEITSSPPGALVYVSDKEVGRTPLTMPFTWYGDYDIILRKAGYETLKTHRNIRRPAYEIPPIDLLSQMAPWTYHDQRYLHFELKPRQEPEEEEIVERARELREKNRRPVR